MKAVSSLRKISRYWRIYGIFGAFQELTIRRTCWSIKAYSIDAKGKETSISDQNSYVQLCELAVANQGVFSKFRKCLEYRLILEHVTKRFGKQYLDIALRNSDVLGYYDRIKIQNSIGDPVTFRYKKIGRTSPTTLRYLKVLVDLIDLFGPLDNKVISEIGVGFGGQAHAIAVNQNIEKYLLFDLPPVLELNKKFLGAVGNIDKFEFIDGRNPSERSSDLVISNYAFSELNREIQLMYLERVIPKAKMGYITWNELSYKQLGGLSVEELLERIPGSILKPEKPLTFANNVIIAWGIQQGQ